MPIYKYLIEIDNQIVRTYCVEAENFIVLRLHGGETYKLNFANVADYWRQWEQETGHTSEDSTDICLVWREGFDIKNFFAAGKVAAVQTVSPTTWTSADIEKFFSLTARQLKSKLKTSLNTAIRVKTASGQKFLVSTLDKLYPLPDKKKFPSTDQTVNSEPPKQEKPASPPRKKILATSGDIATAWKELSQKHKTT